jgi:uncharacterized cupin superfamily protein
VRRVDLNTVTLEHDDDDPKGYEAGYLRIRPLLEGVHLGATLYELEPGNSNCPYHYEYGREEWLLVLQGTLTVRHPGGEDELGPNEIVAFVEGPDGAHKLTNKGTETVRFLMFSTQGDPSVAIYPDSDKLGAWTAPGEDSERIMVRRSSNVDYWEGELESS